MPKKTSKKRKSSTNTTSRVRLPRDLEDRLRIVWRRLSPFIDWCDSYEAWKKRFCSEVRPYRETFYWEGVADIVADYMLDHPTDSPEDVVVDCLVATQQSPSPTDPGRLITLREMWNEVLCSSTEETAAFVQSDLELARQEGTYEVVAALYEADEGNW